MGRRLGALLRRPATGAVAGQMTQAVAGLALQVAAARFLGAAGLAAFSLVYGALVLVTAVSSGLVGDSLTVLDRHRPRVRAALQVLALVVAVGTGLAGALVGALTGLLTPGAAVLLAGAGAAFVLEDTLRRLLMATGRYWALPAVDGTVLVLSVVVLAACAVGGPLTLSAFLGALLAGQLGGAAVAWWRVPAAERPGRPRSGPALREVWAFGAWRAAGQMVRPGLLTGLRLVVAALAGAAVYGPLEAARVYTAPALVVVQGLGSYLLPHYVATRDRAPRQALRGADAAAGGLAAAVALLGVLAVVLHPLVGPLLTGGAYTIPLSAVIGWSAYAVASAVLLPYSGLATVQGRQRRVLLLRLLEFAGLGAAAVVTAAGGAAWAPLVLAVGPLLVAAAVRGSVLNRGEAPAPAPAVPVPTG